MAYVCPPGFDCAVQNSCPGAQLECPSGYFCSDYSRVTTSQVSLEFLNSIYTRFYGSTLPPGYLLQSQCFPGFFCANGTSMAACPAGTFCPGGMPSPPSCDGLSLCGPIAFYQINFVLPIVCAALSAIVGVASAVLIARQRAAAAKSRAAQASASVDAQPLESETPAATPWVALPATAPAEGAPLLTAPSLALHGKGGLLFSLRDVSLAAAGLRGRLLLDRCSTIYPPGSLCAVMGPSGSGKTVLLNVLRGRSPGKFSGQVSVNGCRVNDEATISTLRKLLGFVAKEDVLDRRLTPRELFTLSARQHLPAGTPQATIAAAVERTLRVLNLEGVADVIVGGGSNAAANISGGQLKRVSVGIELVCEPRALFLDEPTSGLDATAALGLTLALKTIAESGVTVVAVLHQPRPEVWALLDRVTLLVAGGSVAYDGPRASAVAYIEGLKIGLSLAAARPNVNPADWVLDAVTGGSHHEGRQGPPDGTYGSEAVAAAARALELADCWRGHVETRGSGEVCDLELPRPPPRPGLLSQTIAEAERTLVLRLRNRGDLILQAFLQAFLAVALASGFSPFIQELYSDLLLPPIPKPLVAFCPPFLQGNCRGDVMDQGLRQLAFFTTVASGVASAITGVGLFGGTMPMLRRDVDSGLSPLAFGVGRMLADLLFVAWNASLFAAVWMLLAPSGSWYLWLAIYSSLTFTASGFGYCVAVLTRPTNAAMFVVVGCLAFSVFSGFVPPLKSVADLPVANWLWYLSFATWVDEAVFVTATQYWRGVRDVQAGADAFGYNVASIGPPVGAVFGLGLFWRAATLYALQVQATGRAVPVWYTSTFSRAGLHGRKLEETSSGY